MRLCAELADLGMDLARAVAAKAHAGLAEPEQQPAPAEPPAPEVAALPRAASARAPGLSIRAPFCRSGDPALIFTRLAACVRGSIALEARLAAGLTPTTRGTSPALRNDPRRASLRHVFGRVTEHHPDRAELVRATTARIDEDLAADPERTLELSNIFFGICEDFGIEVDLAILPDEYLGFTYDPDAPDPHATSPP